MANQARYRLKLRTLIKKGKKCSGYFVVQKRLTILGYFDAWFSTGIEGRDIAYLMYIVGKMNKEHE
jgi:hypothetical protein